MDAINTRALTKYYGKARGIIDLNLSVSEGEYFGFIGPNGAGKSTTIRCLLGLIRPTSGEGAIFGHDIARDTRNILALAGYMPAEAQFYSGMRARDIIRLSAKLRGADCGVEAKRLCERLALDDSQRVEELSLGNRKKVSIVCALQHKPRLYILDEPTSGLDPLMQREFFALLKERHSEGATIFLSSHVLSEVQRNCERAAIIREGRVIAVDRMDQLKQTGAKRVQLHCARELPKLDDVRDLLYTPDGLSFLYGGDMNALMRALAGMTIDDVTIAEPDLEEVFMHYYEKGGD